MYSPTNQPVNSVSHINLPISSDSPDEIEFQAIDMRSWSINTQERYLISSIEGLINQKAHIFLIDNDNMERYMIALNNSYYNATYLNINSLEELVDYFSDCFDGMVIFDDLPESANVATPLVKIYNSTMVHQNIYDTVKLWSGFVGKPVLANVTELYQTQGFNSQTTKAAIYSWAFETFFEDCSQEAFGMITTGYAGAIRSQLCSEGIFTFWQPMYCNEPLDPRDSDEDLAVFESIIANSPQNMIVYGYMRPYGCNEHPVVSKLSANGKFLVPTDHFQHMPFWKNLPIPDDYVFNQSLSRSIEDIPLENKLYIAGIYSDGDNLQYVSNFMREFLWENVHGAVPTSYEMSPSILNIAPALAMLYYEEMTPNDYFVNGVGGKGYVKAGYATESYFNTFWTDTKNLMIRLDQRELRTWDSGDLKKILQIMNSGPERLEITSFIEGYFGNRDFQPVKIEGIPYMRMREFTANSINEYQNELEMVQTIAHYVTNSPKFLVLHLNCWNAPYSVWEDFVNKVELESSGKVVFVTAGQLGQLMLQADIQNYNQIYQIISILASVFLCIGVCFYFIIKPVKTHIKRYNNKELNDSEQVKEEIRREKMQIIKDVFNWFLNLGVIITILILLFDEDILFYIGRFITQTDIIIFVFYPYQLVLMGVLGMSASYPIYTTLKKKIIDRNHVKGVFSTIAVLLLCVGLMFGFGYVGLPDVALLFLGIGIIQIGILIIAFLLKIIEIIYKSIKLVINRIQKE